MTVMIQVCATCETAADFHSERCLVLAPEPRPVEARYYPKGTAVAVPASPSCDICVYVEHKPKETAERALYDGATQGGSWANMCAPHFRQHGQGLGLGRGQRLIVEASA